MDLYPQKYCDYCSKPLTKGNGPKNHAIRKFCGPLCQGLWRRHNVTYPAYIVGNISPNAVGNPSHRLWLKTVKPYICEVCELTEWLGTEITLHMDHIDGDRNNNTVDNLRWLCPNCHQQTETWGIGNVALKRVKRCEAVKPC